MLRNGTKKKIKKIETWTKQKKTTATTTTTKTEAEKVFVQMFSGWLNFYRQNTETQTYSEPNNDL